MSQNTLANGSCEEVFTSPPTYLFYDSVEVPSFAVILSDLPKKDREILRVLLNRSQDKLRPTPTVEGLLRISLADGESILVPFTWFASRRLIWSKALRELGSKLAATGNAKVTGIELFITHDDAQVPHKMTLMSSYGELSETLLAGQAAFLQRPHGLGEINHLNLMDAALMKGEWQTTIDHYRGVGKSLRQLDERLRSAPIRIAAIMTVSTSNLVMNLSQLEKRTGDFTSEILGIGTNQKPVVFVIEEPSLLRARAAGIN